MTKITLSDGSPTVNRDKDNLVFILIPWLTTKGFVIACLSEAQQGVSKSMKVQRQPNMGSRSVVTLLEANGETLVVKGHPAITNGAKSWAALR